jgi:hypothetical protein
LRTQNYVRNWRISLKKSLNRSFWGRGIGIPEKTANLAGPGRPQRLRPAWDQSGDELCQLPQILDGGGKQEFVASAAWSLQPQSSEPQNPLKMRK